MRMRKLLLPSIAALLLLVSCGTPKDYHYFQDLTEGQIVALAEQQTLRLQPDDYLRIIVETKDAQLSKAFNKTVVSDFDPDNTTGINRLLTYRIDHEGNVVLPYVGKMHIAGMKRREAELLIENKLRKEALVNDAVVTIEGSSWTYSVLGEVNSPGRKGMPKDHLTIIEAIGDAGDLTAFGMRNNIMVIRKEGNQERVYRVDLTQAQQLMSSPAFYVQQDDIIYVKANDKKARQSTTNGDQTYNYSFWLSLISVLTTLGVLIFK